MFLVVWAAKIASTYHFNSSITTLIKSQSNSYDLRLTDWSIDAAHPPDQYNRQCLCKGHFLDTNNQSLVIICSTYPLIAYQWVVRSENEQSITQIKYNLSTLTHSMCLWTKVDIPFEEFVTWLYVMVDSLSSAQGPRSIHINLIQARFDAQISSLITFHHIYQHLNTFRCAWFGMASASARCSHISHIPQWNEWLGLMPSIYHHYFFILSY